MSAPGSNRLPGNSTRPDFVIVGAQKSGSTALMNQLARHPNVYLPRGETRYFRDPWFQLEPPSALDMPSRPSVLRYGIKCPDLLAQQSAPARISAQLQNVQLVAVLRDPVQRAVSAYFWAMQWGLLPLESPERGLRRVLHCDFGEEYRVSAQNILGYGRYGEQLENYYSTFSRAEMLILLADDIREDLAAQVSKVHAFLRVPYLEPVRLSVRRSNEGVYSMRRLRFLQRRHKHLVRPIAGFPGVFVQPPVNRVSWLRDKAIAATDRLVLARICDNRRPTLSPGLLHDLSDYYQPDVEKLSSLLDRDLSRWLRPYRLAS